jgi:hypothetical protein
MPILEGVNKDDSKVVELAINDDGTRALAKTKKAVFSLDLQNGNFLQTFRPTDTNADTGGILLSPDAKVVAMWVNAPKGMKKPAGSIAFRDAESAQLVSSSQLEPDVGIDFDLARFTPEGTTLLLPGTFRGKQCIQAASVANGDRKTLALPMCENKNGILEILVPVPGRPAFATSWSNDRLPDKRPSHLSVLDLEGAVEQPMRSVDIQPWRGIFDQRLTVSPDGTLALMQDVERFHCSTFEVVDLQTDRLLMKHTECDVSFSRGCFTPDGKRFMVVWGPLYRMMYFGGAPNRQRTESVPCTIQLYDVASQQKLAEYTPDAAPETLVISGDGKTMAYSHDTKMYAVDFKTAFRTEPLAPVSRASDFAFASK